MKLNMRMMKIATIVSLTSILVLNLLDCGLTKDVSPDIQVVFSFPNGAPALNQQAEIQCKIITIHNIENFKVWAELPDGLELISGDLAWTGAIQKNQENLTIKAVVKSIKVGNFELKVHSDFPSEQLPNFKMGTKTIYISISEKTAAWGENPLSSAQTPSSPESTYTPPPTATRSPSSPIGIDVSISNLPIVNELFIITCNTTSFYDMNDIVVTINLPEGTNLVEGTKEWEGSIRGGIPTTFSIKAIFTTPGKWTIEGVVKCGDDTLQNIGNKDVVYVNVGIKSSSFGWEPAQIPVNVMASDGKTIQFCSDRELPFDDINNSVTPPPMSVDTHNRMGEPPVTQDNLLTGNTVTLTGYWFYYTDLDDYRDNPNQRIGIPNCYVEVCGNDGVSRGGWYTDANGFCSISNIDPTGGIKLRIYAYVHYGYGDELRVITQGSTHSGLQDVWHTAFTPLFNDIPADGGIHHLPDIELAQNYEGVGALWIESDLDRAYRFPGSVITPGPCTVEWTPTSDDGDFFLNELFGPFVHLKGESAKSSDTVIHEYGHNVMWNVFDGDWPEEGHYSPHSFPQLTDTGFAWVEGWATFFAFAVNGNPVYTWSDGSSTDLEEPTWETIGWNNGDAVEGRIVGALLDVFDSHDDGYSGNLYDQFNGGFNEIWDTFSRLGGHDETFISFWNALKGHFGDQILPARAIFENTIVVPEVRLFLTPMVGPHGTISPPGRVSVIYHGGQWFDIIPANGYYVSLVLVDGNFVGTPSGYLINDVVFDHAVEAYFAPYLYQLTYTAGAGGWISGTSPQTVAYGGSGTPVTAIANTGYHFVQWNDSRIDNPRTDTNVTGNISITASFAANTYTLTYTAGAGGSISGTSPQTVSYGGSGTPVTAIANTGYHFVQWNDSRIDNPRTDTNVTGNISVTASFAANTYTLTYTAGAGGSISGTSPQTVSFGGSGTAVTAIANTGYHFVQWNDSRIDNPRTDTNVTGNISATASFAINTYTLTYTAGAGGSISGTSPQTVSFGGSGTAVTAIANTGYHFVQWNDSRIDNPRTDTNVTGNISATASFAINTYTLTYTAGAGGSISGTSPQTVSYGGSGTAVTAIPNTGYHFVQWNDSRIDNPRTDTNVTGNITVTASFAQDTLDTIQPSPVSNLAAGSPTINSLVLTWTAPGDDGNTGTAASYDIRYSTSTITEGNWPSAVQVTGEPAPLIAGSAQNFTVTGLSPGITYYFAMKTSDEVPNVSAISNFPTGQTTSNTGWMNPSANAATSGGDNNGYEVNPTSAYANDSAYASNLSGAGDRHLFYNYGLNIPAGATVSGIEVRLDWWLDSTAGTNSMSVELSWDGGTTWTAAKQAATERTNDGNPTNTVGGVSDNWGHTWTASQLNDANFRVRLTCNSSSGTRSFYLDWVSVRVTCSPDITVPGAIANLAAGSPTINSITLSWTSPGDDGSTGTAASYDIRYSTSSITEGNWASATQTTGEPAPLVAGTAQNFIVTGLNPGTLYYFAIKTLDEVPNVSAISNIPNGTTSASTDTTAPAAVANLAAGSPTVNSVTLSWTSPGDDGSTGTAASYDIRYSTSSITEGNWASATQATGEPIPLVAGTPQSFIVTGLTQGTTYYFALKTSDEVPNVSAISNCPSAITLAAPIVIITIGTVTQGPDTTPPAAVTNLASGSPTNDSVTLTWTAPGDDGSTGTASSYDIRYSTLSITEGNWASATQATGEPTPLIAGTPQSFTVTGLTPGVIYYFALKTSDEVPNVSAISNCQSGATTGAPVVILTIGIS